MGDLDLRIEEILKGSVKRTKSFLVVLDSLIAK